MPEILNMKFLEGAQISKAPRSSFVLHLNKELHISKIKMH